MTTESKRGEGVTRRGLWSIGHTLPQEEVRDYNRTFFYVEYLPATRIGGWRAAKIRSYFVASEDSGGVPVVRFVVRPDDVLAQPKKERDFATLDEAMVYAKELVGPGNIEEAPEKRVMMLSDGSALTIETTEGDVSLTVTSDWLKGPFVMDLSVEGAEHLAETLRSFASHQRRVLIERGEGVEGHDNDDGGDA